MRNPLFKILGTFTLIALICGSQAVKAQQLVTIRGKVVDKGDKLPVIGTTVVELDKDRRTVTGVTTDINGNFALRESNTSHQISVSFIGYRTFFSGAINNRTEINV